MPFNSLEELKAAVDARREGVLTLEVDLGGAYSPEHEEAKRALATAKGMKSLAGGQGFLADNIEELERKVEETRPPQNLIWVQYKRIPLPTWSLLMKKQGLTANDQYEEVLKDVFVGVYGEDPVDDEGNPREGVEPLSTDPALMSSKGNQGILPGGGLHSVVQSFMAWQNSGGEVSIRPTKSGRA